MLILTVLIGVIIGTATGLLPGVHINTLTMLMLILAERLNTNPINKLVLIISIATTHMLFDTVPSTLLGVPSEETALVILPNHRLVLKGQGLKAINKTATTMLITTILVFTLLPFEFKLIKLLFHIAENHIKFLLIMISLLVVANSKDKNSMFWSVITFLMSGIIGKIVLDLPFIKDPLLPMFSGFFGASIILQSLMTENRIPPQSSQSFTDVKIINALQGILYGTATAILPGVSTSQIISTMKNKSNEDFIEKSAGTNTANFLLAIVSAYAIKKYRNGVIAMISSQTVITPKMGLIAMLTALTSMSLGLILLLKLERIIVDFVQTINYKALNIIILLTLICLVALNSGGLGMLIFVTTTAVGTLTQKLNVRKSVCMGSLILPQLIR